VEGGRELRLVLVRVGAHEFDYLTVTVSGLFVLATRFVDHPQAVVTVVYLGEAHEELTCCVLGVIELAGAHQIDDGVGRLGEIVLTHHQNLERTVTGRNVGSGGATSPTDHAPVRLLIGGYPGSETSLMAALCCVNIRPDGVGSLRVI
jgi:hypothetical protein